MGLRIPVEEQERWTGAAVHAVDCRAMRLDTEGLKTVKHISSRTTAWMLRNIRHDVYWQVNGVCGTLRRTSGQYARERQFMATSRTIVWTEYMRYRAGLRGFDLARIEDIVRHSPEQYFDIATGRRVAVGRHDHLLVIVPYEMSESTITPITVHTTTRQQINFRLRTGRFVYEQ
jgi:hypothetical protein